ncbi:MAG: hypothetical protein Crog4KO_35060 [Crocinitomicaceae bacterium]
MKKKGLGLLQLGLISLLLLLVAGGIATLGWYQDKGQVLGLSALGLGLIAILLIPRPRQPQAVRFKARTWVETVLKWVSAPQIEAVILLWFGVSIIAQPQFSSAYSMSQSYLLTTLLGWGFILLAWQMAIQLPSPLAYSLMTGYRLLYTGIVLVNVATTDGPLIILGAYLGGILHGILAMLVQWQLRQMALQMSEQRAELEDLKQAL